jgi:hypothetical protein
VNTEAAATEAANEASFGVGFDKVSPSLSLAAPDAEKTSQPAPKAAGAAPAPAAEPAKDPWEGVQPAIRTHLEAITGKLGKVDKIEQDLKVTAGRVGALQSQLATAQSVRKDGGAAPSAQQIQDAQHSGKEWTALLEAFPDFKAGLEERFKDFDTRLQQQKPFDADGLRSDLQGYVSASTRELREFARLDSKHDDWESTINTPEFAAWTFSNGPTPTEQAQWRLLKADSPDKAEAYFSQFAERYPQWWAEKGKAMASSSAKDAIALLDGYQAHTKSISDKQKRDEKNAQRLEGAVMPRSAGAPPGQPTQDDEAAFNAGYKKVAKK